MANMNWQKLLSALEQHVTRGQVTTYGNCSFWAFGHREGGQAISAMLEAAAKRGHQLWTNRVVADDGNLRSGARTHEQLAQLKNEGVPFCAPERVDFTVLKPVPL